MTKQHPNVALIQRVDLRNLAAGADLFAADFVWHFFNPRLPDMEGDYVGVSGLQAFFEKLGARTAGSFDVEPVSIAAFGDELVVAHTKNRMQLENRRIEIDAVTVWRVVDGQIAEVWDIPAVNTPSAPTQD